MIKVSGDRIAFLWLQVAWASLLYAPAAAAVWRPVGAGDLAVLVAAVVVQAAYFYILARAYGAGDLSIVYPLSRGLSPVIVAAAAAVWFGERLWPWGAMGIGLIAGGVIVLHLQELSWAGANGLRESWQGHASRLALLLSLMIAAFSLIDKVAVARLPILLYIDLVSAGLTLALLPFAVRSGWGGVRDEWRRGWWRPAAVGLMSNLTYLLLLGALARAPVSYVVGFRQLAIPFGVLIGVLWLREPFGRQRVAGGVLICVGAAVLALART